jgi:glycerophosphoryl diester phosphodiesterase
MSKHVAPPAMFTVALFVASALIASACGSARPDECPALNVVNIGHRGTGTNSSSNLFPENTIESFVQGVSEGAQMIELDVTYSADEALVVIHDATVDRTTNGTGCVTEIGLDELQTLDAAFGTSLESTGVFIPTLVQALEAVDVDINIEIKVSDSCAPIDTSRMAQDIVDAIASDNKNRRIIISSFDVDMLSAIRRINDTLYLGLLTFDPEDFSVAATAGFSSLNVFSLAFRDAEEVYEIQNAGLDVIVWTENAPYSMSEFMSWGVDMIITDEPEILEGARSEWCDREGYASQR